MRKRLISSLCSIFCEVNDLEVTPDWCINLYRNMSEDSLIETMQNWRRNYPDVWNRKGVYVM